MRRCWLLALVGCGRLGFDPMTGSSDAALTMRDGMTDAPTDASAQFRLAYVKPSNTEAFDDFGYAIALSGDGMTLAVAAPQEDSGASGINGNQADNAKSAAGAVYVFVRSGTTWMQQAYVKASNPGSLDFFGNAVALSFDGNTLAVGAVNEDSSTTGINTTPDEASVNSGAVYVFNRIGTTWSQQAYVKASNTETGDQFGFAVALSVFGDVLAVGAPTEDSSAVGVGGDEASNLSPDSGAAYLFKRAGTTWTQHAYVKASNTDTGDLFGSAVALSADGTTLVVGAPDEDSGAGGIDGNQLDNSVSEAGAAYVLVDSAGWSQQAYIKPSAPGFGDFFAKRVSLGSAGIQLLCSAAGDDTDVANSGAAYLFIRSGTTWTPGQMLKASNAGNNDQFAADVALSGDGSALVIGAPLEDSSASGLNGVQTNESALDSGAAYGMQRSGGVWTHTTYVKPTATSPGDHFGWAVAISHEGNVRAASMPLEDSLASGVNGNALDESANASGAVIIGYY